MVDTKVRIINKRGEDVLMDNKEVGEIIVKGKGIAGEELDISHDGWLYTGDLGTMDESGRITVVKSNQDINGNETQLSTIEIEKSLIHHPAVEEVSVVPRPDEELGEIAQAFVVLAPGWDMNETELIKYVKNELKPIESLVEINLMDELPKTSSGKILKTLLGSH